MSAYSRDELQNVLYQAEVAGERWQILCLEFGPRKDVVEWAKAQMREHSDAPTILITHDFVDHYSTLSTSSGEALRTRSSSPGNPYSFPIVHQEGGVSSGDDLWAVSYTHLTLPTSA